MTNEPGSAASLAGGRAELLTHLPAARVDGGFGWLDESGGVDPARPVELWITGRMTHVAALGALAHEPADVGGPSRAELVSLAAHGVASLAAGPLRDAEHDGWFAIAGVAGPVATAKQAYGHAFVILAASSALAAGVPGARALLDDALRVSDERFWDEEEGLSVEEWTADWGVLDEYRGVNANMHTVEAYLAAGDVTGDGRWHERAGRIAARVVAWASANEWRIPEHFDASWTPILELNRDAPAHPFRPYGATVGHGLEWARLLLATDRTLGERAPAGLSAAAIALYDRAVADGWAVDGADGFVYTTDWDGTPVVRERMHWVVAEAVNAAQALGEITGDARYARDAATWWAYAQAHLVDHERGSWHHELDTSNRPAATVWSGKPDLYHAYQAMLMPELPLVPSFAQALRSRGTVGVPILVVGESVLDVVRMQDGTETAHAGGSPANVAVGLARLGQRASFLTELGDDAAATTIRAHLDDADVRTHVAHAPSGTPVATATIGSGGAAEYDFAITWTLSPDSYEVGSLDVDGGHVHTGSIATHLAPGAPEVALLVERARERASISYDPNIRASLVGDRADVVRATEAMVAMSDVVKASDEDLEWLYPGVDVVDSVRAWSTRGPAVVVATLGAAGSVVCVRDEVRTIAPVTVDLVDTVGAGDSYMAALLDGLGRERLLGPDGRERLRSVGVGEVVRIAERAARAAAITVSRAGANPPSLAELTALAPAL